MAVDKIYQGPYWDNLGITYSSPTFTVRGARGVSLSSFNPATVVLPSKATKGAFVKYTITTDQTFIDDTGGSQIIGNLFGLPTGVAYTDTIPFFLYAVSNDAQDTIAFMVSRVPHAVVSPTTSNIGTQLSATADTQGSFYALPNITISEYDQNPCFCLGSFRMTMSASDDWTVTALDDGDGCGLYQEFRQFTVPLATWGAATGTYFLPNGGTAPVFTTNIYRYYIEKSGYTTLNVFANGDGGTDGAGAVAVLIAAPYIYQDIGSATNMWTGFGRLISTGATVGVIAQSVAATNTFAIANMTTTALLTNATYGNGARTTDVNCRYKITLA